MAIFIWQNFIQFNKIGRAICSRAVAISHICFCACMFVYTLLNSENNSHTKSACDSWESIAKFIHVEQTQILVFHIQCEKGASGGEHRKVKL